MLPFLAACLIAQSAEAPRVETVASATARIGAALGRIVGAEPGLARLPVLIDTPGLDPNVTLRTLAFALHASIVADGKALRIERTSEDRKAVEAAHGTANRARVVAAMTAWDDVLKRADAMGDVATQVRRARADRERVLRELKEAREAGRRYDEPPGLFAEGTVNPASRLTRALVTLLGPDRLADLAPDEVRFFSDHPNGAETGLPNCAEAVAAYVRTQTGFAKAMGLPEPEGPPAKTVLKATEGGVSLDLYDNRGKRIDHGSKAYGMNTAVLLSPPPAPDVAPAWTDLDGPTRRLRPFLAVPNGLIDRQRYAALPDEVLHPERRDPLDFEARTGLLAAASPEGKGLVVALTDGVLSVAERCVKNDRLDTAAFAWRLAHESGYERVARDGMAVMRPKDPWPAEMGTIDRPTLGKSIRRIKDDGETTLENWSALCLALYPQQNGPAAYRYLWPLNLGYPPHFDGRSNPGLMALLGAVIQANVPVADGNVRPFDRLLRDGVAQGWLAFSGPDGASDLDLAPSTLLARLSGARVALTMNETLLAAPYGGFDEKGVPVKLAYEDLDVAQIRKGGWHPLEPEALGMQEAFTSFPFRRNPAERAEASRTLAYKIRNLHYLLGRRRETALNVILSSGSRAHFAVVDVTADRRGTEFADLPAPFQAALLQGAERGLDAPVDRFGHPLGMAGG